MTAVEILNAGTFFIVLILIVALSILRGNIQAMKKDLAEVRAELNKLSVG